MARYYNKDEVLEKLRKQILREYGTYSQFAKKLGVYPSHVTNVLKGRTVIPDSWLCMIGYESETIYKKKG